MLAALLLVAALAAGLALFASATSWTAVTDNRHDRARYVALSGLNSWRAGRTGTFSLGGDVLTLSQTGPDAAGVYSVTCRASVDAGTGLEANAVLTAKRAVLSPITFSADLADFATPILGVTENVTDAITVYAAHASDTGHAAEALGVTDGFVALGNAAQSTGALWYQGSRGVCTGESCPDGMCRDGVCTFGKGLRAYFGFVCNRVDTDRSSADYGDGFTFTIANALTNDPVTAAGGMPDGSLVEYLGYAGPGPGGSGIEAPKLAVEVDFYPNLGDSEPTMYNSRKDAGYANHVAVVFWGDSGCYDDNRHGAGALPANPDGPTTENVGYYQVPFTDGEANWLEDGRDHALRLEVHRQDTPSGGSYLIEVWIDGSGRNFADVTADYAGETPQIAYTATMDAVDHRKLDTILFGWTEGSGRSPQTVDVHDFNLEFRR